LSTVLFAGVENTGSVTYNLGSPVHAWLMNSVDCIEGNAKPGVKFLGAIANTYNSITDEHCQRTPKNLKDNWATLKRLSTSFAKAQL
jgi:hypothetical protein